MAVGDVNDVLEKARSIEIDDQVKRLKSELENVDFKINRNKTYIASLDKIQSFDKDLGILTTNVVSAGFYSVPTDEFDNFRQAFTALSNDSVVERIQHQQGGHDRPSHVPKRKAGAGKNDF